MVTQNTWFDAFFKAITSSPEFKSVVEKDWWTELEQELKKMDANIAKASDLMWNLKQEFASPEVIEIWNKYESKPYINRSVGEKDGAKTELKVEYFENKNPATFWFAWIAWMQELKDDLRQNFIKPLEFKFFMQELEKKWTDKSSVEENTKQKDEQKIELYKKINDAYSKFGVSIPTWLLFYGPPGTGKTFITKKLAEELGAGLIKKSVWEFGSSYIHQTSQNIKKFFEQAKTLSEAWPIILFLDEIDSLLSKRTDNIDQNKAEEISQFLQEFNALDTAPNLIVIAATNRPDHLDSAIMRSWRLDKKFYIWLPDKQARKELFEINIAKENIPHTKLDYEKLADLSEWYVAADIEAICDQAARDASKSILELANSLDDNNIDLKQIESDLEKHKINQDMLEKAISQTTPSTKFVDMSVFDEWLKEDKKQTLRV